MALTHNHNMQAMSPPHNHMNHVAGKFRPMATDCRNVGSTMISEGSVEDGTDGFAPGTESSDNGAPNMALLDNMAARLENTTAVMASALTNTVFVHYFHAFMLSPVFTELKAPSSKSDVHPGELQSWAVRERLPFFVRSQLYGWWIHICYCSCVLYMYVTGTHHSAPTSAEYKLAHTLLDCDDGHCRSVHAASVAAAPRYTALPTSCPPPFIFT